MKEMKSVALALCCLTLLLLICGASPGFAQEVTASITGTITDPSGAPILGATVTAKDVDRGTSWSATTNEVGIYNILKIPVGNYSVRVEVKGFETAVYPTFTLVLNQTARVDIAMKVGAVTSTVEVIGVTPILQAESAQVSTVFDANTTTALPLAARNYIQLALLSPGTTTVNPSSFSRPQLMTNSGRPDINGNREQAVGFLLDGIVNQEAKNNEVAYTPNVDAIEEFNVVTQNPGADFGNYAGGVISVSIKSGTNTLHGDAFEFLRNDYLNSNSKTASWATGAVQPTPTMRYNMFGGTIGGPIKKDKLFFFADYQGLRWPGSSTQNAQVLTQQERSGDFGQLCTQLPTAEGGPGTFNTAGTCSNPAGQLVDPNNETVANPNGTPIPFNVMSNSTLTESKFASNLFADTKDYPLPTSNLAYGNNITFKTGDNFKSDQGDLRIDYKISDTDSLYGRYSKWDISEAFPSGLPFANAGAAEGTNEPGWSSSFSWMHDFSSSLENEVRLGSNAFRFNQDQTPTTSLGNISQSLGISGANAQAPGLLQVTIPTGLGGNANLGLINLWQIFRDTELQAEDNLVYTKGRHTLLTGFQFIRERNNYVYPGNEGALGNIIISSTTNALAPAADQVGVADLWAGITAAGGHRDSGSATLEQLRGSVFAGYFQDNWKVRPTLTLNLGIRFEDHTPLYEVNNRVVNFGLESGTIETVVPGATGYSDRALYNNYVGLGAWNPRVGIAWSPRSLGGKTVVRAAYGSSSYIEGGGANEELSLNLPYGNFESTYPQGIGTLGEAWGGAPPCPSPQFSCYAGSRIRIFDQNFRPALIQQWNLTIQHQFSNTLSFQIGYVGQKGAHLLNFEDVDQRIGLNAQGTLAQPGQPIVSDAAGPFLGGLGGPCTFNPQGAGVFGTATATSVTYAGNWNCGTPGSLYNADASGNGFNTFGPLAGANMSNSNQRYDGLQAILKEHGYHGLDAQLAYTFSKCLSNSPGYFGTGWGTANAQSSGGQPGWENIYDPNLNWGPCYYDQKHIIAGYFSYELPFGRGKAFGKDANPVVNAVIGNWQISGILTLHSGNALTLNDFGGWGAYGDHSGTNSIEPQTLSTLPNCNGPISIDNKFVPYSGGVAAHTQWFDPSNISTVTGPNVLTTYTNTGTVANPIAGSPTSAIATGGGGSFGTCSVGNIRGPWTKVLDMSLQKEITVSERKRLQLRLDAFNAFNNAIWTFSQGPASGSFDSGSASLGWITGSQGARQLQLALKFLF
ncbi:MAG TPA: TonB-dependent receptor [Candidatus Acidoferrum sp.]|nr:TonB-dependent receptor [Candidatus Acidoferrum sp.]